MVSDDLRERPFVSDTADAVRSVFFMLVLAPRFLPRAVVELLADFSGGTEKNLLGPDALASSAGATRSDSSLGESTMRYRIGCERLAGCGFLPEVSASCGYLAEDLRLVFGRPRVCHPLAAI